MGLIRYLTCGLCSMTRRQTIDGHSPSPSLINVNEKEKSIKPSPDSKISYSTTASSIAPEPTCPCTQPAKEPARPQQDIKPLSNQTSELPTNRALCVASKRAYEIVEEEFPIFENEDEVVIESRAVGLNPIDWKSVDYNFCLPSFPWITGREMAGVVKRIGSNVTHVNVGDHVWTSTYYRDRRAGCFQTYVTVPAHTVLPLPQNLSFTSAACLGVAGLTSAMTLWKWLDIPMTSTPATTQLLSSQYLLIWGGSAITAQFAIQIACRSGIQVLAVTSEKTSGIAEALGARVIVRDGKTNEEIVAEIKAIGGEAITRAIDLVGTETATYCLQALSTTQPCLFAPLAMISSKAVVPANVKIETVEMKKFVLERESRIWAEKLNRLVESGEVRMPVVEVMEGGLDVVQEGLERVKRGDLGGRKLVVAF